MTRSDKARLTVAKAIGLTTLLREATVPAIEKAIYKSTDCGAWIRFDKSTVEIGSIVEGVDSDGTMPVVLKWPFTQAQVLEAIKDTEAQAQEIWNQTHGCDDCGPEDGETGDRPVNPDCVTCHGEGVAI